MNSAVGQMLKPMIDNMQQTAMANYGDFAGMGAAAKPNLPPLNQKYDIALKGAQTQSQSLKTENETEKPTQSVDVPKEIPEQKDIFPELLAQRENAATKALKIPIIRAEFAPKMTCDVENARLYVAMIGAQSAEENPRQSEVLSALAQIVSSQKKQSQSQSESESVSEDALSVLDELLLMCDAAQLFPAVSLLRLLLVLPSVARRYSEDFMILQQVLCNGNGNGEERE